MKPLKIFMSAGEASGDMHGAPLIEAMRRMNPGVEITFLGGDLMARAAGHAPLIHYRDMAFMAFSEVIRHAGKIFGNLRAAKEAIGSERPDAVVLIDYPGFNFKLMKYAWSLGIPVYYYIAPKVWAWKEWRVKSMKRYCRKVLSILPFEEEYFRGKGLEVEYVGNPSLEEVDRREAALPPREEFLEEWGLDDEEPLLALVPGSRRGEIRNNLPVMAEAAARFPGLQPVIAAAPAIGRELYIETLQKAGLDELPMVTDATFELIRHSEAALVTSGTATLETALLGTPQVVCYRANGSKVSYALMRRLIKVDYVSLPNLIEAGSLGAGKGKGVKYSQEGGMVAEMLLHRCTPDLVAAELGRILPGAPGREEQLRGYGRMRARLGGSTAAESAAASILADLAHGGQSAAG